MTDGEKRKQLWKYKLLATGLFVFMVIIYVVTTFLLNKYPVHFLGYVRAFAEAGMVGALADWFAVTALFNKPLRLPIPHTNLIENSKQRIGNNLGNFVSENFLTAATIRPYIEKLEVSKLAADWLIKEKNLEGVMHEIRTLATDLLNRTDDAAATNFIAGKVQSALPEMPVAKILAETLSFLVEKGEHEEFVTVMSGKIKDYIKKNEGLVKDRVTKESFFFIPKFVDDKLSEKITKGLYNYFEEIEVNMEHPLRGEITGQLLHFVGELTGNPAIQRKIMNGMHSFVTAENISKYASYLWLYLKRSLLHEMHDEKSSLISYIKNALHNYSQRLQSDPSMQHKIDSWIRLNAYRIILRNKQNVSNLISSTVGNWEGRELSNKLELEVGKDLQYIRINGTLVGGLMGLLIYAFTHLFDK